MCRWIVFKKCRWVVFNCVDELSPKTVSMSCLVDELSCSLSIYKESARFTGTTLVFSQLLLHLLTECHFAVINVCVSCSSLIRYKWHIKFSLAISTVKISASLAKLNRFTVTTVNIWTAWWWNLYYVICKQQSADPPAHPHSLISTFVIHCIDSIISIVALASFCCWTDRFESSGRTTPKTGFILTSLTSIQEDLPCMFRFDCPV